MNQVWQSGSQVGWVKRLFVLPTGSIVNGLLLFQEWWASGQIDRG